MDIKKVPCKYCGELTHMTGTQKCDGCWEVTSRLRFFAQHGDAAREALREALGDDDAQKEVERLKEWCAVIREVTFGSDIPKNVRILINKALRGESAGNYGTSVLRSYRARAPQNGSVGRSGESDSTGSSPASSLAALCNSSNRTAVNERASVIAYLRKIERERYTEGDTVDAVRIDAIIDTIENGKHTSSIEETVTPGAEEEE